MLQLGIAREYAGQDDDAKKWYERIGREFADSPQAKKAAGAARRIDSVGTVLTLSGKGPGGETVDLASYRGKAVLIQYWATWSESAKNDMAAIKQLADKYRDSFDVLGVSVDANAKTLKAYLAENPLPWQQIFEEGGQDSRPANALGIITVPTMILVDAQGKVVNRNIQTAEIEAELKKLMTLTAALSMLYRRFGRTELRMPVLTCGGMRYQYQWQDTPLADIPAENQANLEATVRRALDLGIHHIETARGYGSSERQLGCFLKRLPREQFILQTKIQPTADPRQFLADFRDSLARLEMPYVDLLGIHGINDHETLWWSLRPGGCLAAARELVAEGLVRHVGFSTHGPLDVIQAAIAHEADGGFEYVNLHWYYIFQQNWPAIEAASRADMGVFIISPSDKGGMLYKPPAKLTALCQPLHPLIFNALFCLSRPEVHTLSIGAAARRLRSAPGGFALAGSGGRSPAADRGHLRKAMLDAVGPLAADRFAEGLPAWQHSPGYMNMSIMLWLRNLVLAYDMLEYGKMRYNLLGNGGHWFPGLVPALDELNLAPALAASPLKEHIPLWLREIHALLHDAPKVRLSQS